MARDIRQQSNLRQQGNPSQQSNAGPKSAKDYLAQLEELLKLNSGQGTFQGSDVSSNRPMYIPGQVRDPSGLGQSAPSIQKYGGGKVQPDPVNRNQPMTLDERQTSGQVMGASDFIQQFNDVYSQANQQPSGTTIGSPEEMATGVKSTADGGVLFSDGIVYYYDGTFRAGSAEAYPIASDEGGGTKYSDGSIRASYESLGLPQAPQPGGLKGLIMGIFNQNRVVTQAYGNEPTQDLGYKVHGGTDIRTKDLENFSYKIPVDAEVVEINYDGRSPYGNSLLLKLPSGEMLRFSHMAQMIPVELGSKITAGQPFGIPGSTGNSTAEHLDLEYFNTTGERDNPQNFSGFTQNQQQPKMFSSEDDPQAPQLPQLPQTSQLQPQQQSTPISQSIGQGVSQGLNNIAQVAQPDSNFRQSVGQVPEKVAQATNLDTELGLSETLTKGPEAGEQARIQALSQQPDTYNPFRQLLGNVTERIGDTLGIPEGAFSEAIAGGPTKRTGQAFAEEIGSDPKQEVPGIRQNIQDIFSDVKDSGQNALGKAGEGLKGLANTGVSSLANIFQPKEEEEKRVVGDVKGSSEDIVKSSQFGQSSDTAQSLSGLDKNDIRDPFFKYGGSEQYKDLIKPNAQDLFGGALNMDIFQGDFYKDLGNIGNVFGGSKDLAPATEKYIDFEKEKYKPMSRMNWEEGYGRGAVDNYNKQIDDYNNSINNYFSSIRSSTEGAESGFQGAVAPSSQNIFSSQAPNQSFAQPQISKSFSAPKPSAQSFAKPSQNISRPQMSVSRPSSSSKPSSPSRPSAPSSPKPPQQSNRMGSSAPQMSVAPRPSAGPAPKARPQMSREPAPKRYSAPKKKSNVFSNVWSYIRNIFR